MTHFNRFLTTALLTVSLLLASQVGVKAQSPLSAAVDRTTLTTDDTLTLTVVVNSGGRNTTPQLRLPELAGFTVVSSSTSSQLSIVNGAMSSSTAYHYALQPYTTGTLTIAPVTATLDGQTYSTEPIVVEVIQGNGAPTQAPGAGSQTLQTPSQLGNQDLFVEATVDNDTPYVGEQITYTFRFFEAADSLLMPSLFMDQPTYAPPALSGFWSEGELQNERYRVTLNGRVYTVTELRTALFPTAAGPVTIEPAQLTLPSFGFQRGGVLHSEPVTLEVKPLPAGAPAGFTGAVGQYDVRMDVDTQQTALDEPVTATITVDGWGNIGTAGDPLWPESDGWRAFYGDAVVNTSLQDGRVRGTRAYEHTLIPTRAGELELPAVEYSYFDPTDGAYHTATTASMLIGVAPGPNGETASATMATLADSAAQGADAAQAVTDDTALQPMPLPATLIMAATGPTHEPWYWLLWIMPLAALGGGFAWQQRQAYQLRNADALRRSRAHKSARRALAKMPQAAQADGAAAAQAGRILTDYLSIKLGINVSGTTSAALAVVLRDKGVAAAAIAATLDCLADIEAMRYSPTGPVAKTDIRDQVETLINTLDTML